MAYSFLGGIHLNEHKDTAHIPTEKIKSPAIVSLPLSQHIGAPAIPIVKAGEAVTKGQLIAKCADGLSCPVHASVSGKVRGIEDRLDKDGKKAPHIVIENDGLDTLCPDIRPYEKKITDASSEEIIEVLKNSGITGMGGAGFPAYAKVASAIGKAETLIINCAECEPYITANHRLLLEDPDSVIGGVKILLRAIGIKTAYIAIEDNKPDVIKLFKNKLADSKMISYKVLKTKYPQGDERQLIFALAHTELPAGKLPADMGYVVFNAETASAIYYAFATGMPLVERTVTVSGDCVANPKNLRIPLGTSFRDAFDFCGGFKTDPGVVISGGPMMGFAVWDLDTPVVKGTGAVLALVHGKSKKSTAACIHCGRCAAACPMRLMPMYLAHYSEHGEFEVCEKEFNVMSCVECGCCSYVCPAEVPIIQHNRLAKARVREMKAAQKKGAKQ